MSVLEKTIEIIFQGDDRSAAAMNSVLGNMTKIEGAVRGLTGPLASVADDILKFDAALAGLSLGALAYSVKQFADFEDVMLKVKGIIGASEADYKRLTEATKGLGATTRYTATEAAQGLEFLALAGFKVDEALGALPEVLKLAQASATDLGRAADIVTNIMAGYGIRVDELARANDVLTATFTNSNTSLDQLGQAFKFVGPVAKAMGLSLEETASILGILGNAGYQAEMGGTALRNILLALVAPAGNFGKLAKELGVDTNELGVDLASAANALKSLGVEVKGADGNLRPFASIMDDMQTGLEKIPDSADRAAILIEIFGKRGGPQMAALLEQGSGAVLGLENEIRSLGGITDRISKEMESGMGGAVRSMKSAFEAIAIEIGTAVSQKIVPAAGGITEVFRSVAKEVEKGSFDPLFDIIGEFADKFSEFMGDVAEALPEALDGVDYSGLASSFESLIDVAARMFNAIFPEDVRNPEGLQAAIQKIVNAWAALNEISAGILQSWEPVARAIGAVIQQLSDGDGVIFKFATEIGNFLGGAQILDKFIDKFGLLGSVAATAVINGLDPAAKSGSAFGNAMVEGMHMMDDYSGTLGEQVVGALKNFAGEAQAAKTETEAFSEQVEKTHEELDSYDWRTDPITLGLIITPEDNAEQKIKDEIKEIQVGVTESGEPIMMSLDLYDADAEKITQKVEELTSEKLLEIKIRGEIDKDLAKIKADAETIQAAVEWHAKLEIAQAEAAARRVEAAFESVNTSITSTGDTLTSLFSLLSGFDGQQTDKWLLEEAIEQEMKLREQAFELQKQQIEAEIKLTEARLEALAKGDALISIDGGGLQPHLEAMMWEIFSAIQIRANQEGFDTLLLGA